MIFHPLSYKPSLAILTHHWPLHQAPAIQRRFPVEYSGKGGSSFLRRFTTWVNMEGFWKPLFSLEAAMACFHMKAETTSTCLGCCTHEQVACTLSVAIAEAWNTNLLVTLFPFFEDEASIAIDKSLIRL